MMSLRARDNNIQSFAYTWPFKGNQNELISSSGRALDRQSKGWGFESPV